MNKKIFLIVIFVFILASIGVTVFLVRQRQELRKEASVPGGQATISFSPSSETHPVGESFPVTIRFNTEGLFVVSLSVRLQYLSGAAPDVVASGLQTLLSSDWMCPVKTITPSGNNTIIDIACANTSATGFSSTTDTDLAVFNLVANQMPSANPVVLRFDAVQSKIQTKAEGQDILLTPASTGSYTIAGGGSASPTPTPSASPGISPSPSPSTSPSPSPSTSPSPSPSASPSSSPSSSPSIFSSTSITAPQTGATVTDSTPTISGKTVPGATVTITINSPTVTATVTADANGTWSYTPTSSLGDGSHTVSITAQDPSTGQTVTKTSSFLIASAAGGATVAPTTTPTATGAGQPVTGNSLPTLLLLGVGLLLIILSLVPQLL